MNKKRIIYSGKRLFLSEIGQRDVYFLFWTWLPGTITKQQFMKLFYKTFGQILCVNLTL